MSARDIGLLSGGLVFLSVIPYIVRIYDRKIQPVLTSWSLWSLIGLALLLTYRSAGADANVWPAVFGFVNPTLVAILSAWRNGRWKKLKLSEQLCFLFGLGSLALWLFVRRNRDLSQYALFVGIAADLCATLPTILFVWAEPQADRPLAWVLFAAGYFLAVFAIEENTVANWLLPLYMTVVSLNVALPLILYRFRTKAPLREWV